MTIASALRAARSLWAKGTEASPLDGRVLTASVWLLCVSARKAAEIYGLEHERADTDTLAWQVGAGPALPQRPVEQPTSRSPRAAGDEDVIAVPPPGLPGGELVRIAR